MKDFLGTVIFFVVLVVVLTSIQVITTLYIQQSRSDINPAVNVENKGEPIEIVQTDQSLRLCEQNPYAHALNMSLAAYGEVMDNWITNKVSIEKKLMELTQGQTYGHDRFKAFEVMGECNEIDCVGGPCNRDTSKIACGAVSKLEDPCVVYSVGGNNEWQFEMDVLDKTPCEVHTFDCTGDIERFVVPENPRLHFHHICLGTENKKTETGEFWTMEKMTDTLNHTKIDLFKMDIEGYEFPLFQNWPHREYKSYDTAVLPMQVMVEIHSRTHMPELSWHAKRDWKFASDMINLQEHLLKMGYVTIVRDDNSRCGHCTELTLMRIRCPG